VGGYVSFLLRQVEEGEGEDGMVATLLMFRSSLSRGFGFVTGQSRGFSSRDEARVSGRTKNVQTSAWSTHLVSDQFCLVYTSGLWSDQAGQGLGLNAIFLPYSDHGAGSTDVLDGGFDLWDWPFALLLDAPALPASAPSLPSELRFWRWYPHYLASFSL